MRFHEFLLDDDNDNEATKKILPNESNIGATEFSIYAFYTKGVPRKM